MGCVGLSAIVLILLPVLILLLYFQVVTISFAKLGLSPQAAVALLVLSLAGSVVNIPLSRRRALLRQPANVISPFHFLFYMPPRVREQVIAINLGGAIIPIAFSVYLLAVAKAPLWPTALATAVVALVAKLLARPRPGVGIVMPVWIPPLLSVGLALLLAPDNGAPVAYVSGAMGTLIGADLLNFPAFRKLGGHVLSIGGAGVFDGIFLVGIAAAVLAV